MAQRVLPEWSGPDLIHVRAGQAVMSFGYNMYVRTRTQKTNQYIQRSVDRAAEADGEPCAQRTEFPDPEAASVAVKDKAREFGADQVGITHVDQYHVYKGADLPHKNAIVIAVAMDYDALMQTPSTVSMEEIMRIYDATGGIAADLAGWIRGRGYPARTHTLRFDQLSMLPHAYAAGLGELGKHGSLVNRDMGNSFRVSVVTTDLPLMEDSPRLEGIQDFCASCQLSVNYCPGDAISHEKQDVRGIVRWMVDTKACAPYWGSYYSCGICLEVCPWNARGFGGRFKGDFIRMIKGIDLKAWREELKAGLQEPWTYVERPTSFPEDWRNRVKPIERGAQAGNGKPSDLAAKTSPSAGAGRVDQGTPRGSKAR